MSTRRLPGEVAAFTLCLAIPRSGRVAVGEAPWHLPGSPQSCLPCAKGGPYGSWGREALVPLSGADEVPGSPTFLPTAAPAGMVVCNWVVILSVCITVLCVFDPTGRTFVKLRATKRRQRNLRTYNLRSVGRWAGGTLAGSADQGQR